jgi:putative nucleotidyltransferase with HDIG domain
LQAGEQVSLIYYPARLFVQTLDLPSVGVDARGRLLFFNRAFDLLRPVVQPKGGAFLPARGFFGPLYNVLASGKEVIWRDFSGWTSCPPEISAVVTMLVRNRDDTVEGALAVYLPGDDDLAWFEDFFRASALVDALGAYDRYTKNHSRNVAFYSAAIAKVLGLSQKNLRIMVLAAILHDIGKISIPAKILTKPGGLEEEEYTIVKKHPEKGVAILEELGVFLEASPAILHHHEKYGGGGYPFGIRGEEINFLGRIISVADAFDAMTSERSYRKPYPVGYALRELARGAGKQFDPAVVEAFFLLWKKYLA